jgi:hypothetical protein
MKELFKLFTIDTRFGSGMVNYNCVSGPLNDTDVAVVSAIAGLCHNINCLRQIAGKVIHEQKITCHQIFNCYITYTDHSYFFLNTEPKTTPYFLTMKYHDKSDVKPYK